MRKPLVALGVLLLVSLPALGAKKEPKGGGTILKNTGLESRGLLWGAGDLLVFYSYEAYQGADLDGDGDLTGRIFQVYDGKRNRVVNTEVDFGSGGFISRAEPGVAYISTREAMLGDEDLNGDGDLWDPVVHIYDQETGRVWNTGWVGIGGTNWRRKVFLGAPSVPAGQSAQLFDLDSGEREDLGFDFDWVQVIGDEVVMGVSGGVHRYDPGTGALTPLGLEGAFRTIRDGGAFAVFEFQEIAGVDLNGDGDFFDRVPVLYEPTSGAVTVLDLALARQGADWGIEVSEGWAAFVVSEFWSSGQDLNGDGDVADDVLFSLRLAPGSPELVNTGESVGNDFWHAGPLTAFHRAGSAFEEGFLAAWDAERGEVVELGGRISFPSARVTPNILAFSVWEGGVEDLNGNGYLWDYVIHYYDRRRGGIVNTRLASFLVVAAGEWLGIRTRDCGGRALAGDRYECVVLLDTRSGRRVLHGLPNGSRIYLSETIAAVETEEHRGAFRRDLNGDGDAFDHVLFLMELPVRGKQ